MEVEVLDICPNEVEATAIRNTDSNKRVNFGFIMVKGLEIIKKVTDLFSFVFSEWIVFKHLFYFSFFVRADMYQADSD